MIIQLAHLKTNLRILIRIKWCNTGFRGAKGVLPQALFLKPVKVHMIWHHHLRAIADEQLRHRHATRSNRIQLRKQRFNIQRHAGTDDIVYILMKHAGRQQMQGKLAIFIDNGMTGVCATLEANDHIALFRQQVCYLPFALIAPVGANNGMNHEKKPPPNFRSQKAPETIVKQANLIYYDGLYEQCQGKPEIFAGFCVKCPHFTRCSFFFKKNCKSG